MGTYRFVLLLQIQLSGWSFAFRGSLVLVILLRYTSLTIFISYLCMLIQRSPSSFIMTIILQAIYLYEFDLFESCGARLKLQTWIQIVGQLKDL